MSEFNDYSEPMRYMSNAYDTLKNAGIDKEKKYYLDEKYVKTACGIAYNGILKALDVYFGKKDVPKIRGRKSVEYYIGTLAKINKKQLKTFDNLYKILHLAGYYDGVTKVNTIKDGLEEAEFFIKSLN
jgi:hypothetical protein